MYYVKNGPIPASFSLISSLLQTVHMFNKSCRWQDSNPGTLVSEVTTLSNVQQPLPDIMYYKALYFVGNF